MNLHFTTGSTFPREMNHVMAYVVKNREEKNGSWATAVVEGVKY